MNVDVVNRFPITVALTAIALAGSTAISVAQTMPPASDRFAKRDVAETPDFQMHIVPLLGRLGCNGRSCHGSFQGRGDLRLSLFGYDFAMDHKSLTTKSRVDRRDPDNSLVLQKPLAQIDHEGGRRFAEDSWQHHLLRRWIMAGAPGVDNSRTLSKLEVEPAEVIFSSQTDTAALQVIAVWQDGRREDVTPLCRFRSNDDSVVTVDADGGLETVGSGDTHVVVFYDNGITSVPVLRPRDGMGIASSHPSESKAAEPSIDSLVLEKLDKLGITPSPICTDTEFLRRVSLDLTGTLPMPNEVVEFISDTGDDKRNRKVDELLQRSSYAAWWANKLCDFTGCNPSQQAELGQETSAQWYMWVYERLRENVPYDELVRRMVLATSREDGQSYDDYAAEVSGYFRDDSYAEFAKRQTMPHYWTRRSMQKPEDAAQAFAHNFLGVRLQCAQCHKHPFAPWTQDDFKEFSCFFETLKYGVEPDSLERYRELAKQVGLNVRGDDGSAVPNDVLKQAQRGRTVPWRELYVRHRDAPQALSLLRSGNVTLGGSDDPRRPIMDWIDRPDNPWFARAFVNRVWAGYFHVGIIDPPDDLNPANPPSNPALLDWLVDGFIKQNYDIKWLHRQITTSQTYQRSWVSNETNANDRRNFSRSVPRRMPAEVVYDSVKQALAGTDRAVEVRTDLSRRAIGHLSMRLAGTYAMQVFGKPDRAVNCDCERANAPTLLQSIFMQNDPLIDQRLGESGWLAEIQRRQDDGNSPNHANLINDAWLRTLSRPPTKSESDRAADHLASADSSEDGLRDLLWALINTKEFVTIR